MEETKFNFEDLKVYNKALQFVDFIYQVTKEFPKTEQFGLTSQFTRASISIAANIAEGSVDTDKQFNRFLQLSLGSLNECVVYVSIAYNQNYIATSIKNELREKLVELSKMITSLQKYLKNKTNN